MSLIPAFEIGLWNAWIFMLYLLLLLLLPTLINKFNKGAAGKREICLWIPPELQYRGTRKVIAVFRALAFYLAFIYSVFLPLQLGTIWFYIGLPFCLFGVIMLTTVMMSYTFTPLDEPITTGLYRYSRHPMYLAIFLTYIGISITSASWIFLLYWIIYPIFVFPPVIAEERFCLGKYGEAYHEYMNRTPRWIGILKSRESEL